MTQLTANDPTLTFPRSQAYRDWLGVSASVLCAIHCAAMPFVVGLLPLLGLSFLAEPSFHKWMVGICLALALLAFVPGWRRHHRLAPTIIGLGGLGLITLAAFAGPEDCCPTPCDGSTSSVETASMVGVAPGVEPCIAACCDTEPSDRPGSSDGSGATVTEESCEASCCSADGAAVAVVTTQVIDPITKTSEATCAAPCCATEMATTALVTPTLDEASQVADPASCTSDCCPDAEGTTVMAGTGDFMSMVWLLMTPIGGVILVVAHLTNHRLSQGCKAACCSPGRDQ